MPHPTDHRRRRGHTTLRTTLGTGLAALLLAWTPPQAGAGTDTLRGKVELSQTQVLAGGTRVVYARLALEGIAPRPNDTRERPPLNVSLVLDRSGSMADEGKIDYLRRAASFAVDRLERQDTVSVVEYDDQITLLWPARRVSDTAELKSLIARLEPRGSTNLAGGMQRGIDEARTALSGTSGKAGTLTRVVLMSDGLANTGITDPQEIAGLVRQARQAGIRVSALGLGRDYDEDLMQAIAENGGGRYYYIEHPSQMARVFQDELGTLADTCARELNIVFSGKATVRKAEIVGYDDAGSSRDTSRSLEDLYAGEKRTILLRLEIEAPASGNLDVGRLALAWRDARTGARGQLSQDLSLEVTGDRRAAETSRNRDVAAEAELAESDRVQKDQVKLYQEGRHAEARRNLDALANDLEGKNIELQDERVRRKIEALRVENRQMATAAASPVAQKDYLKASKQRLYQAKSGKRSGFALQPGDRGREVEQLQEALRKAGAYKGPIDGIYDDDVSKAVEAYQKANSLGIDGIAGAGTMDSLGLY